MANPVAILQDTKYQSTLETATAWNCTQRRVAQLCAQGRVKGAFLIGGGPRGTWVVPRGAPKPPAMERAAL